MNSETYGMFGPQGLLAKIETEETWGNPVYQNFEVPGNNDGSVLSSTSGTNLPNHFVPLSDLPPMEAAFSIEKIWRAIFSFLEPKDLLKCRLVSSSWLRMATNDRLLKWDRNTIVIRWDAKNCEFNAAGLSEESRTRPLKDLTDVLDGVGTHPFTCSKFWVRDKAARHNCSPKVFEQYGFLVKDLHCTFLKEDSEEFGLYSVSSLMEFVIKLLAEQMPNLEVFTLFLGYDTKFVGEIGPQLLVYIKKGLLSAGKQNQNLRTINIATRAPYEVIETACCLAPKLERLRFDDLGFWVRNKHRLNLLKEFIFRPRNSDYGNYNKSNEAIANIEEELHVQKLTVRFFLIKSAPEMWRGQATSLKRIFDKNSNSLEELYLFPTYFLPETTLHPMPKVKLLSLNAEYFGAPKWGFLPQGISIATTFPNLHTIKCYKNGFFGVNSAMSFQSSCTNEEVPSVKKIIIADCEIDDTVIQRYFRNAVVSLK